MKLQTARSALSHGSRATAGLLLMPCTALPTVSGAGQGRGQGTSSQRLWPRSAPPNPTCQPDSLMTAKSISSGGRILARGRRSGEAGRGERQCGSPSQQGACRILSDRSATPSPSPTQPTWRGCWSKRPPRPVRHKVTKASIGSSINRKREERRKKLDEYSKRPCQTARPVIITHLAALGARETCGAVRSGAVRSGAVRSTEGRGPVRRCGGD